MDQDLLKPSLQSEWTETESYDIGSLWYAVFFGGLVTTIIMASRNAMWLKVRPTLVRSLIGLGILLLFGEIVAAAYLTKGSWSVAAIVAIRRQSSTIRWIRRGIPLGLYLLYYLSMKGPFQQHLITKGELKPLLKDSIIWILIGGTIEAAILIGGSYILSYVM